MNNTARNVQAAEPFEERVDILLRELELACKWQRPSILLATFDPQFVHADARLALEKGLANLAQEVHPIHVSGEANSDIPLFLAEFAEVDRTVFFVDGLRQGGGPDGRRAYRALNIGREVFIDRRVRVVFWLTGEEASELARGAPDFWAYRHRVVEFVEPPAPAPVPFRAIEASWQGIAEFAGSLADVDAKIALREAMLEELPQGDESISIRGNLLFALGVLHWRRGDCEKASRFLQTTLEIASYTHDAWFEAVGFNAIALVNTTLGKVDDAVQALQRAAALAPDQTFPWSNLGCLCNRLDRNEEAVTALERAIQLNPLDAASWSILGNAYRKLGRSEEAIALCQKSIALPGSNKDKALAWNRLGHAYRQLADAENAIAAFQNAIELDPDEAAYKDDLDVIHREVQQPQRADVAAAVPEQGDAVAMQWGAGGLVLDPRRALFTPSASLRRDDPAGAAGVNAICNQAAGPVEALDEYGSAIVTYQRDVSLALLDPQEDTLVAVADNRLGFVEAPDEAETAPRRPFAWIDFGDLSRASAPSPAGAQEEAAAFPARAPAEAAPQESQPAVSVVPKEVTVAAHEPAAPLGDTAPLDRRANDQAIATYRKVTELNPTNARAWHTLGNLFRTSGRYHEALAAFEQAVALDPDKEVFHYHLGLVYAALERYQDAIGAFQRVVELNPNYNLAHCTLAGYYRRLGQETEARRHITIALPTMKDETEYNRACFAAICGDADQALTLLRESLEKKQTTQDWVRRDPDFEFVRSDPRFAELVGV
jgi:tetratricopeptide (TPR) repeat protein